MKQKFRTKAVLLKGDYSLNELTMKVGIYGDWSYMAKNALQDYRVGDKIRIKVEPWEDDKTEAMNNYFHLLLKIYFDSGLCSYENKEELKMAVKMNMGCGVTRWGYLDMNHKYHITKDEETLPSDAVAVFPIIKSWADYTFNESIKTIDRLIVEMLMVGVNIDDIKLEYEEKKAEITQETALKREKENAWKWTSMFVRLRECRESTGTEENGVCFTCGRLVPFNQMDAGHFLSGRHNSVLFDAKWIRGQCKVCNQNLGGNPKAFREKLVRMYGEEAVSSVESVKYETMKMTIDNYNEIAIDMKARYKGLKDD